MKSKLDVTLAVGNTRVMERRKAAIDVIRIAQRRWLDEIYISLCPVELKGRSSLPRINPFLCDGIMLFDGRLQCTQLSKCNRHPMIFLSRHAVTGLVFEHYHEIESHIE